MDIERLARIVTLMIPPYGRGAGRGGAAAANLSLALRLTGAQMMIGCGCDRLGTTRLLPLNRPGAGSGDGARLKLKC